jgi:hypothetical protein
MNLEKSDNKKFNRRTFITVLTSFFLSTACETKPMKVVLNVVLFSYLDRPIFDVYIDDGGFGETSGSYPNTGKGVVAGVSLTLGPKKVSWRLDGPEGTPRNGETVVNKNALELTDIVPGAEYLGVHIYPDETVEFSTSVGRPDFSAKGLIEGAKFEKR